MSGRHWLVQQAPRLSGHTGRTGPESARARSGSPCSLHPEPAQAPGSSVSVLHREGSSGPAKLLATAGPRARLGGLGWAGRLPLMPQPVLPGRRRVSSQPGLPVPQRRSCVCQFQGLHPCPPLLKLGTKLVPALFPKLFLFVMISQKSHNCTITRAFCSAFDISLFVGTHSVLQVP